MSFTVQFQLWPLHSQTKIPRFQPKTLKFGITNKPEIFHFHTKKIEQILVGLQ